MYKVVLAESDPMVRHICRGYIDGDGRFEVAAEFGGGREALDFLAQSHADLALLELLLPGIGGIDLMRGLLEKNVDTNIIVVTASTDAGAMADAMRLGAVDYMLKPFSRERMQVALDKFAAYADALPGLRVADQETIDFLAARGGRLEKSLRNATEERMMNCFVPAVGRTAREVAEVLELSDVTARRYLKRLVQAGRLKDEMDYGTGGHPRMVYRLP